MTRIAALSVVLLVGCMSAVEKPGGGSDPGIGESPGSGSDSGSGSGSGTGSGSGSGSAEPDQDGDHIADSLDNCPALANRDQTDTDGDGYGDMCDCDPNDPQLAADLVAQDSLATNANLFAAADGFAAANWSYANDAFVQTRLANNASDAAFFVGDTKALTDVVIDVTAASTAIQDFDTSDLRQLFLLARASSSATQFSALGCGMEVVEGLSPTQKTSVVTLGGTPAATTTTPGQRTNRTAVQVNEQFTLRMELRGDTMTCTAIQGGTTKTVATASGLSTTPGSVGVFTRETKAAFKNIRICAFRPAAI